MTKRLPTTVEALTPEWVTDALRDAGPLDTAAVSRVDAVPIGEQGQTSVVIRLALSYDGPVDDAPHSLIAKLPSPNEAVRATQQALGGYAREVCFYRDVGNDSGIAVPRCYAADLDPDSGGFVLLLEDMSDCRVGDIWSSNIADVTQATEAMASMHAQWWCAPELRDFPWLPQHDDSEFHFMLGAAYKAALPAALARYPEHFTGYVREVAEDLSHNFETWIGYREGRPFTLIHNDFHPKQLFFRGPNGGRFAAFDWQSVVSGRPTFDLARLLLKGLSPDALREHRDQLLRRYRAGLADGGVNIPFDELATEWRSSLLHTLAYTVFVLATTDVRELDAAARSRGVDYRDRLIGDLAVSLEDNQVHELLPA